MTAEEFYRLWGKNQTAAMIALQARGGRLDNTNWRLLIGAQKATQEVVATTANTANATKCLTVTVPSPERANSYIMANSDLGNIITVISGNVYLRTDSSFTPGSILRVFNNSSSFSTITQNSGVTLYMANNSNAQVQALTGNRFISPRGYCTITCVAANTFVVTGTGVT